MCTTIAWWRRRWPAVVLAGLAATLTLLATSHLLADGKVVAPRSYEGSLEERSQEAILIFHGSREPGKAQEDLILKISVLGEAEHFAWVIPFPDKPEVAKEDARLFKEVFDYVEARIARPAKKFGKTEADGAAPAAKADAKPVEVLSRKIVGKFDVAVVRENQAGALNGWLETEGYQTLTDADDVLDFYRRKKYVYACIKVSDAELSPQTPVDLHPLRFSFATGGRDGMYFPMKMTGLQQQPFDVNLYIFYKAWVNDRLSKFGYEHRGFRRKYRDWDTRECEPNAGKTYSTPQHDVFLRHHAHRIPTLVKLFQRLHPGQRYYLTNIQARLEPEAVRNWSDDLWLFPYYTNRDFVPYDARPGGPASAAWPESYPETEGTSPAADASLGSRARRSWLWPAVGGAGVLVGAVLAVGIGRIRRRPRRNPEIESTFDPNNRGGHGPV